jgi:hypothetical protein
MSFEFLGSIEPWQWGLAGVVPPAIFALYFLKLKRKRLEVPSTWLWKKSIEDLHVNSLWQRLRKNILLWLQLAAAAAALLALGRPVWNETKPQERVIIIIDHSASMNAGDGDPTRLDAARAKALEIVDGFRGATAGMVIASSDVAKVLAAYTENDGELRRAIRGIQATQRRTDHTEAFTIASGLANPQKTGEGDPQAMPATLYLISDGKFPPVTSVPLGNLELRYLTVGTATANVGIASLAVRPLEKEPDRVSVLGRVRNYGDAAVETSAELLLDGKTIDLQRVSVPPKGETPMSFRLAATNAAILEVKLDVKDALEADNRAWAVLTPPKRARILVVSDGNRPLKAVLETGALGRSAEVTWKLRSFAEQNLEGSPEVAGYDLIIFDRCTPKTMPDCQTFFLGALPTALASLEKTDVEFPGIVNWNSGHPVMRFLTLDDVTVYRAFTVPLPKGADTLLESDRGPIVFALQRGPFTDLVQTFPIVDEKDQWQTDWPLKLSFPLYALNVVRTLAQSDRQQMLQLRPGDPFTLRAPEKEATLTWPSGRTAPLKALPGGRFEALDTEELGVYKLAIGASSFPFAVNLCDEVESDVRPADQVKVGDTQTEASSTMVVKPTEGYRWLALAVLAVLALEWWIYNKRVHV